MIYTLMFLASLCSSNMNLEAPVSNTSYSPPTNASQIVSTNDLGVIEKILEEADENTLVLWDVDQTLLTPNDPILKPKWEKLLDQMLGGKKFIIDDSGKTRYIFREILMNAPHSLVDYKSLSLIERLKKRNIPVIAFSAAPGGKIGSVDSFVDWRLNELQQFGFDFSSSFPNVGTLTLPKDPDIEYPPIYKGGVLITSLHDKGPVLLDFFKEVNWKPNKVIFIDDQMSNIKSVVESLEGIQTIGVHYLAASDLPCTLDENAAKRQVELFIATGQWISEKDPL